MAQDSLLLIRAKSGHVHDALKYAVLSDFTDVTLVFADCRVQSYRSLLWLLAPWWREALNWSSSLVILQDTTCQQFIESLAEGKEMLLKTETVKGCIKTNTKLPLEGHIQSNSLKMEDKPVKGEIKTEDEVKLASVPSKLMSSILPCFSWPPGMPSPSHHRMRWKLSTGSRGRRVSVVGNSSLYSLVSGRLPALPPTAAFSLGSLVGRVSLRDWVNGQGEADTPAFSLDRGQGEEAREHWLSLDSLMAGQGMAREEARHLSVYYSDTVATLEELAVVVWDVLKDDCKKEEEEEKSGFTSVLGAWMQENAPRLGDGILVCVFCGKVCRQESTDNFRDHMRIEHFFKKVPREKDYRITECKICDKMVRVDQMTKHLGEKHDIKPTLKPCPKCSLRVMNMTKHLATFHMGETFDCDKCKEKFTDAAMFIYHKRRHAKQVDIYIPGFCEACNFMYKDIKGHNNKAHGGKKLLCDSHCGKTFRTSASLKVHIKNIKGSAKQKCSECNNLYVDVKDHIKRIHRNTKKTVLKKTPYIKKSMLRPCTTCGESFRELNKHIRKVHLPLIYQEVGLQYNIDTENGEERETIAVVFSEEQSILVGDGKLKCNLCSNSSSATKSMMIAHMKGHFGFNFRSKITSNDSKICPDCGKTLNSSESNSLTAVHKKECSKTQTSAGQKILKNTRVEASQKENLTICPKCGETFVVSDRDSHVSCGDKSTKSRSEQMKK